MSSPIIEISGISKSYRIGVRASYGSLREEIMQAVTSPFRRRSREQQLSDSTIWALKDVSFSVQQGEVVGIIGRNGAGKSTLLKILSRITEPTSGEIRMRGRVASLLEVGTGFHPELTGRENILLNGALLGMSRQEIGAKLDEIIAFAEIEQFIDTPVKRYSSGMYVRLAFAVAAHLEPEILIVDEVLAVGDAQFQKKCLGKMGEVAAGGRTVLFVSHNLASVENLCSRVCVLRSGRKEYDGDAPGGIKQYTSGLAEENITWDFRRRTDRIGSGTVRIVSFRVLDSDGRSVDLVTTGKDYTFRFEYESAVDRATSIDFGFTVRDMRNVNLFRNRTVESGLPLPEALPQRGFLDCRIPRFPLTAGRYGFGFRLLVNGIESDYITGPYAAYFDVVNGDYFGTGQIVAHAPLLVDHQWRLSDPA